MAIVQKKRIGSAVVKLDDDCCQCSPEEMAFRRAQCDAVIARILSNPKAASVLAAMYEEPVSPT